MSDNAALRRALLTAKTKVESDDPRMAKRLDRCVQSLDKYPLPIETHQCLLLEGFNKQVLDMIKDQLTVTDNDNDDDNGSVSDLNELPLSPIPKRFRCLGDEERRQDAAEEGNAGDSNKSQEESDRELAVRLSKEWNEGVQRVEETNEVIDLTEEEEMTSREEQEARDAELARRLQAEERQQGPQYGYGYTSLIASGGKKLSANFDDDLLDEQMLALMAAPSPGPSTSAASIDVTPPPSVAPDDSAIPDQVRLELCQVVFDRIS